MKAVSLERLIERFMELEREDALRLQYQLRVWRERYKAGETVIIPPPEGSYDG